MAENTRYQCLRRQFIKELEECQHASGSDGDDEYVNIEAILELDPNVYDEDAVFAALSAACRIFTDDWLFEPGAILPIFIGNLMWMCQVNIIDAAAYWMEQNYGEDAREKLTKVLTDGETVMKLYRAENFPDDDSKA